MKPSSVLAAVVVLAAPARAITTLTPALGPSQALYALRLLQMPGAQLGRAFDAAALMQARLTAEPAPEASPAVEETPPAMTRSIQWLLRKPERVEYDALIQAEAAKERLDPRLVKSMIAAESGFSARAQSAAGARGLMQLMPDTAESVGVSRRQLFDPAANVRAGTRYLAYLFERAWARFHLRDLPYAQAPAWLVRRVVAAYNAGPRWLSRRPLFRQTKNYVRKVLTFYRSEVSVLVAAA